MSVRFAMLATLLVACGGGGAPDAKTSAPTPAATPNASTPVDAGKADDRAFAGSLQEATTLISAALDKREAAVAACIRQFRVRRAMKLDKITVAFGIDQEGRLLGVTSKGKEDAELKSCVQDALGNANFPRSHAGIITVTKTYEELVQ